MRKCLKLESLSKAFWTKEDSMKITKLISEIEKNLLLLQSFDPTSVGPNPEASEGQVDLNGSYYQSQIKKMRKLEEVGTKDLKSRYPQHRISLDKPDFKRLTLDNLKSLRDKIGRFYQAAKKREDHEQLRELADLYVLYSDEIKRRLAYINAPIKEEEKTHPDESISTKPQEEMSQEEWDRLTDIIKKSGINILSDKELYLGYYVNDVIVGGLYTGYNNGADIFDFDIVVDPEYQHLAIGLRMIKDAIREYKTSILDMNPDAKMVCDVVNSKLVRVMELMGFQVIEKTGGHTKMIYRGKGSIKELGDHYVEYGHNAGDIMWGWSPHSGFKKKKASSGTETHRDHPLLFHRMDYQGRFDVHRNVVTIANMTSDFMDYNFDISEIPLELIRYLRHEFGDSVKMKRFYEESNAFTEGYGAGIPEEDRLNIQNCDGSVRRWQIRSKNAPKTPALPESLERLVNEIVDQFFPLQ